MDTGSIILTSFLSTIPVYLFFATGFYLRHKQVIQADHDAPIMRIAMDVAYPCLVSVSYTHLTLPTTPYV